MKITLEKERKCVQRKKKTCDRERTGMWQKSNIYDGHSGERRQGYNHH